MAGEVPSVETHAIASCDAEEGAIGDAEGQGNEGDVVVPAHGAAVDAGAGVDARGDEDGGEDGAGDCRRDEFVGARRNACWNGCRSHCGSRVEGYR